MPLRRPPPKGELILFPSPREGLAVPAAKLRFGYAWFHELQSPEIKALAPLARLVWLTLAVLVDSDSQSVEIGRRRLASLVGIDQSNLGRHVRQLEASGVLHVARETVPTAGGKRRCLRHVYTLLAVPSSLRRPDPPGAVVVGVQLALPFRRPSLADARALKARA